MHSMPFRQLTRHRPVATFFAVVWLTLVGSQATVDAVEIVVLRQGTDTKATGGPDHAGDQSGTAGQTITGEVLASARDGGVMLQSDDGRIWTFQPDQILSRDNDPRAFKPIDASEMTRRLKDELPTGFRIYQTTHYIIAHNTNDVYVRQVGTLFEQLYRGFFAYWKNQRWTLEPPRFPLVAVVFKNRTAFVRHAKAEIGEMAKSIIGYYHLESNRMVTFNVPNLERNIATIIHEATHQLAYNCGVQTRFADNPMWVSEGLAMFFEAPDFRNPRGWRTIGRVNAVNLARWKRYLPQRPRDSLLTLVGDDKRFRGGGSTEASYAESWALTYFLLKTKRDEFVRYLQRLSEGKPLIVLSPQERVAMVEDIFGMTLGELDQQFLAFMRRVR